jgi:hypothetical protein
MHDTFRWSAQQWRMAALYSPSMKDMGCRGAGVDQQITEQASELGPERAPAMAGCGQRYKKNC